MNKEELKNRLHKYIDEASEEELEEMMYLVEEDGVEYEQVSSSVWDDPDFVREMNRRMEEIESGSAELIPYEEVLANVRARLGKGKNRHE